MKTNFHEKESVALLASSAVSRTTLDKYLRRRGFRAEDDFYHLQRSSRGEPWQSTTLLSVQIRRAGANVYETGEDLEEGLGTDWDELQVDYLLATLPRDCIAPAVREVSLLADEFDLRIVYEGRTVSAFELDSLLNGIADRLASELSEPGSEFLVILIEQQYGSR